MDPAGELVQPGTPPPESPESPPSGAVRRHHTITAASRAARASSRVIAEETAQTWNDDEVVDDDWVGGVGAVGEKNAALHRQASLPTKYNRGTLPGYLEERLGLTLMMRPAFQRTTGRQTGSSTPRTLNSLEAITAEHGHEEAEEEWESQIRNLQNEGDVRPFLFFTPHTL